MFISLENLVRFYTKLKSEILTLIPLKTSQLENDSFVDLETSQVIEAQKTFNNLKVTTPSSNANDNSAVNSEWVNTKLRSVITTANLDDVISESVTNSLANFSSKDETVADVYLEGLTLTVTKGNGSTQTFRTQDLDTTYQNATQEQNGLMSISDKKKLDSIDETIVNKITQSIENLSSNDDTVSNVEFSDETLTVTKANGTSKAYTIKEINVDDELSDLSENPVQNKVIKTKFDELPTSYITKEDILSILTTSIKLCKNNSEEAITDSVDGPLLSEISSLGIDGTFEELETLNGAWKPVSPVNAGKVGIFIKMS